MILFLSSVPGIIAGRGWNEWITIYFTQTQTYPFMYMNYPSFWAIIDASGNSYELLSKVSILFTIAILALIMFACRIKEILLSKENILYLAFLLTYTCVFFLPSMHERYGFPYEMLAIILLLLDKKKIMATAGLLCISMMTYGHFLFGTDYNIMFLSVFNGFIYLWYVKDFFQDEKRFLKTGRSEEK